MVDLEGWVTRNRLLEGERLATDRHGDCRLSRVSGGPELDTPIRYESMLIDSMMVCISAMSSAVAPA